jgi:hypothetical protein
MDGRKALAKAFGDYVDASHWTQARVAAMGGPSTTTQTKIRSTDEPISRQTLRQIEVVMAWREGTASQILNGTPPPPPGGDDIEVYQIPDDDEVTNWASVKNDPENGKYEVVVSRQEPTGTSRLRLVYWPGRPGSMPYGSLLAIAADAQLAADEALETIEERVARKLEEHGLQTEAETDEPGAEASEKTPTVDIPHADNDNGADLSTQAVIDHAHYPLAARRRTTPPTPTPDLDAQHMAGEENQVRE